MPASTRPVPAPDTSCPKRNPNTMESITVGDSGSGLLCMFPTEHVDPSTLEMPAFLLTYTPGTLRMSMLALDPGFH